jgi:hypothetical protein
VSLEGTLETIALPDVLALLSVTAKTGELRIESGGGVGSVWLDAGRVAGFDVGTHKTAVDSLFALLRLGEGHFKFHTGTRPHNAVEPQDVAPVLEEAENRLVQWPSIVAAVPSTYSHLNLLESVEGSVMLRPDQWQLVVTVGGGKSVASVLDERGLGEFDGCKAVKELVDLRLVHVDSSDAPPAPALLTPAADRVLEVTPEETPDQTAEHPSEQTAEDSSEPTIEHVAEHPAEDMPVHTPDLSAAAAETAGWPVGDEAPELDEVADLSEVWNDETGEAERMPEQEPVVASAEPAPEPVNRGLLLKFLGSARN